MLTARYGQHLIVSVASAAGLVVRAPLGFEVLTGDRMWRSAPILRAGTGTVTLSLASGSKVEAVRYRPGRRGRLSALSVFVCKSVFYGAFVWARRALNGPKRRFSARAVSAIVPSQRPAGGVQPMRRNVGQEPKRFWVHRTISMPTRWLVFP